MIHLRPYGGLCNRLTTIASTVKLCEQYKKDLKIWWELRPSLNCSFEDLFEPISTENINLQVTNPPWWIYLVINPFLKLIAKQTVLPKILNEPFEETNFYQDNFTKKLKLTMSLTELIEKQQETFRPFILPLFLNPTEVNYIQLYCEFSPLPNYTCLKPIPAIQNKINRTVKKFTHTIGIHIRKTDNIHSTTISTTEKFFVAMHDTIKKKKNTTFFLSTDCNETKQQLIKEFGEKIIYNRISTYNRNKKTAIQDAVLDLYSLAHTKEIYGSHISTFSYVAAKIFNIPLRTIK